MVSERKLLEIHELKELTQLLLKLWETAQQLPDGLERQTAFRDLNELQQRLARRIADTPR